MRTHKKPKAAAAARVVFLRLSPGRTNKTQIKINAVRADVPRHVQSNMRSPTRMPYTVQKSETKKELPWSFLTRIFLNL